MFKTFINNCVNKINTRKEVKKEEYQYDDKYENNIISDRCSNCKSEMVPIQHFDNINVNNYPNIENIEYMDTAGKRLKFLIGNLDMKRPELANKIGISTQSLYQYMSDIHEPRLSVIKEMAKVLNTSTDFITGLTENPVRIQYNEYRFISKFRSLTPENQAKIEERMDTLYEIQTK